MCSVCETLGIVRDPDGLERVDARGSTAPHAEPIRQLEGRVQELEGQLSMLKQSLENHRRDGHAIQLYGG